MSAEGTSVQPGQLSLWRWWDGTTQVVFILKLQCRLEDGFKKEEFHDTQTNFELPAEI